jgi:hypothetical protein
MSYILEAIKKADQKRKLGSVPDIHAKHGRTFSNVRRDKWPYWAAAAALLVINGGGLGWWLFHSGQESVLIKTPEVASTIGPVAQLQPHEMDNTAAALGGNADGIRSLSARADSRAAATTTTAHDLVTDKAASPADATGLGANSPGLPPGIVPAKELPSRSEEALPPDESTAVVASGPVAEQVWEQADDSADGEGVAEAPDEPLDSTEQEPIILGSSSEPDSEVSGYGSEDDLVEEYKDLREKESAEKALEKIPYYYQLPAAAQQTLPEFHISFHAFSRRPSARIVSVNGKVLREGQELDKKIKLEQITPSGIVLLSADTWRFKVDVD